MKVNEEELQELVDRLLWLENDIGAIMRLVGKLCPDCLAAGEGEAEAEAEAE